MRPQKQDNDPSVSLKAAKKMSNVFARGYITEGGILELTYLFSVPKGTYDIRTVFDETVSRLRDSLWDTNFMFLSIRSLLMMVGLETHMVDLDVGEMFYNFQISSVMAKYCGVDLGSYLGHKKDLQGTPLYIRWVRPMIGLVFLPTLPLRVYYGQVSW